MIFTAEQPGRLVVLTPELQAGQSSAAEVAGGLRHSHQTPPFTAAEP